MSKDDDYISEYAEVIEVLRDTRFMVRLEESGRTMTVYASGKIRKNRIRILKCDRVLVEIPKYDKNKGRIVTRCK